MTTSDASMTLVTEVEPMIRALAVRVSRLSGGAVLADDLAQVARIATFAATASYDATKGAKFSTYAFAVIRNAMGNELRRPRERAVLHAPSFEDSDECYIDGLPADLEAADDRMVAAEREEQVRTICDRIREEQFAAKAALFDAIVARLSLGVQVSARYEGVTFRSEVTLEEIAAKFNVSKQWVAITEKAIKAALAAELAALMEVA